MHVKQGPDSLRIESRQGEYYVEFPPDIPTGLGILVGGLSDTFLVCDANVARLYRDELGDALSSRPSYVVEANEETKSLPGVMRLVQWLIDHGAIRSSTIVAIGGGCIQDLVSFTAHVYYRGVNWVFMPTTLLSQADSCIGAKSGINVLPFKNQLGALHSPRRVVITTDFLGTVPDSEIASGWGEVVKLSVTSSHHFLDDLEAALIDGGLRNDELLNLVRASLVAKREVIEADEYESDLRRILNYGHSFGHAIEALADHKVPHGLGVLWGIDVINWLGMRWGVTSPGVAQRLARITREEFDYRLPVHPSADALIDMLRRDKKVANGQMNFAVLIDEGEFTITPTALDGALRDEVAAYLTSDYVFRRS